MGHGHTGSARPRHTPLWISALGRNRASWLLAREQLVPRLRRTRQNPAMGVCPCARTCVARALTRRLVQAGASDSALPRPRAPTRDHGFGCVCTPLVVCMCTVHAPRAVHVQVCMCACLCGECKQAPVNQDAATDHFPAGRAHASVWACMRPSRERLRVHGSRRVRSEEEGQRKGRARGGEACQL